MNRVKINLLKQKKGGTQSRAHPFSIHSSLLCQRFNSYQCLLTKIAIDLRCFINRHNCKAILNRCACWFD